MKSNLYLIAYTKITQNGSKAYTNSYNHRTLKRKHRGKYSSIGYSNIFLSMTPTTQIIKEQINSISSNFKTFVCHTIKRLKRQPIKWLKNSFPLYIWQGSSIKNIQSPGWCLNGLRTKGSLVQFPVRAHAWVSGQVPSRGRLRGNHSLMFLSLPFSLPSLL